MVRTPHLIALLALAAAAPPPVVTPPTSGQQAEAKAMALKLALAQTLITKGQQQQALDQYIEPVLAHYEQAYRGDKRRVYCARTVQETLLYMIKAAADGTSAVAIDDTWVSALYLKAFVLSDLGRVGEARPVLERARALAPSHSRVLSELATVYGPLGDKDWPRALATYAEAADASALSPEPDRGFDKARALRGQGYVLVELGRWAEAEAAYHAALVALPGDKMAIREIEFIRQKRAALKGTPTT